MTKRLVILGILNDRGTWTYGLEIVRASDGKVSRGTVYVDLGELEEQGLVESRPEEFTSPEIGIQRRQYRLTERGRRELLNVALDDLKQRQRAYVQELASAADRSGFKVLKVGAFKINVRKTNR